MIIGKGFYDDLSIQKFYVDEYGRFTLSITDKAAVVFDKNYFTDQEFKSIIDELEKRNKERNYKTAGKNDRRKKTRI